jgi:hypothetical protein
MARVDQNQRRRRGTGLIALDPDAVFPGYTLFAPLTGGGEVYLVDLRGQTAHHWRFPYRPGRHARIVRGGELAYNGDLPGEETLFPMWHKYPGGVMLRAAPDGTVLWEHRDPRQHHDAHHLDDGGVLYTGLEPLQGAAARSVQGGVSGSAEDDLSDAWTDEAVSDGPAASEQTLGIGTEVNMCVDVTVELLDQLLPLDERIKDNDREIRGTFHADARRDYRVDAGMGPLLGVNSAGVRHECHDADAA